MARAGLIQCLDGKVARGLLARRQAEDILRTVRDAEERYADWRNRSDAAIAAEKLAAEQLQRQKAALSWERANHILALKRTINDVERHPRGIGPGLMAKLNPDDQADYDNAWTRGQVLQGIGHSLFWEGLDNLRPRAVGLVTRRDRLRSFARAVWGENTGDELSDKLADAWRKTTEFYRETMNRAGASIEFRRDFNLPVRHDKQRLRSLGFERWKNELLPRLNFERVLDEDGRPMTPDQVELALPKIYASLLTDGVSDRIAKAGGVKLGSAVKPLQHHRFFQFKTADHYLAYSEAAGEPDLWAVITGHIERMSHDAALVQILGPNHRNVMAQMLQRVGIDEDLGKVGRFRLRRPWIEATYAKMTGDLDNNGDAALPWLAGAGQALRNTLTAAQLDGALISSVGDLFSAQHAAAFNGLSGRRLFVGLLRQLKPTEANRRWAVRRGLIADIWTTRALAAARHRDDMIGQGMTGWLANAVMQVQGLSALTQANRHAFGMEYLATLTEHMSHKLEELPEPLQSAFARHRIDAADWDAIRATKLPEIADEADILDPMAIADRADLEPGRRQDLLVKLMGMIHGETSRAVITTTAASRGALSFGQQAGTILGEVGRSVAMYKNFAVTMTLLHVNRARALATARGGAAAGRYAATLVIGLTLMGAASQDLRDLFKGRDLRDHSDPRFWLQAAFQGGGLGVFGDLFTAIFGSGQTRHGTDPIVAAFGPVAGVVNDAVRMLRGATSKIIAGEPTNLPREALRFSRNFSPLEIWYWRAAVDRWLWDGLQSELDPDYADAFRRQERRAKQDFGQGFWWRPGQAAPSRAPTMGEMP